MPLNEKELIEITVKRCVGSTVLYDRDNEGLRERLDQPYTPKWTNAKFKLPSGKKKCERFPYDFTKDQILEGLRRRYSNFKDLFFIQQSKQ